MDSASGGCDESYSTDIGVEVSACDMEISPGMTKYWHPICANSLKPHVGQQFDSLDSAFGFYKQYAGSVAFDCRQSTTRKGRDGGIVLKHVGRSGEYSSTGRFPLSFAWISGGGSDELPAARGISSPTSDSPPSTFTSTASPSCLCSPSPYSLATALTSSQPWFCSSCDIWVTPVCVLLLRECQKVHSQQELTFLAALLQWSLWCCLGFCSRGSGWGGTSACGIDGPASSGGAFPSSKALSMYPNPKPPDFISACCLIDSSLNVQDRKARNRIGPPKNLSALLSQEILLVTMITSRAKCLLNQGSPASVSNILVIIAPGVIHAVVFSKIALHSRRISGTALDARFVISICPIGSPRVAATSAAVIWIDCPFWSCKHAPGQAAEFVLLLARV
nr:protein FAR1-RELATED SEQUENCE 5-like [Ipomoea batatas]